MDMDDLQQVEAMRTALLVEAAPSKTAALFAMTTNNTRAATTTRA